MAKLNDRTLFLISCFIFSSACTPGGNENVQVGYEDSAMAIADSLALVDTQYEEIDTNSAFPVTETTASPLPAQDDINTGSVSRDELVAFAKTLLGTPYRYGSTNPNIGFDCSGFITYVFNHFNIKVPRSSVDFTNVGVEVPQQEARPGDLILFTGTDSSIRIVGHMGIVVENSNGLINFIHSTSGKAYAVVISPVSGYYQGRFEKVIRVFNG